MFFSRPRTLFVWRATSVFLPLMLLVSAIIDRNDSKACIIASTTSALLAAFFVFTYRVGEIWKLFWRPLPSSSHRSYTINDLKWLTFVVVFSPPILVDFVVFTAKESALRSETMFGVFIIFIWWIFSWLGLLIAFDIFENVGNARGDATFFFFGRDLPPIPLRELFSAPSSDIKSH